MLATTPTGMHFIKLAEGERLVSYQCSAGVWTIGVGHTTAAGGAFTTTDGQKRTIVGPGQQISREQSAELFSSDIDAFDDGVAAELASARDVKPHEFDAMVSLAFNIGLLAFKRSTVLRRFLAGDKDGAARAFAMWNKAAGQVSAGLTRRRSAEALLFQGQSAEALKLLGGDAAMPRKVDQPKPPKTMAQSRIGKGAIGMGTGGAIIAVEECRKVAEHGAGIATALGVPVLAIAIVIILVAAAVWWWRRQHLQQDLV